jgi:hypothetical protein
VKPNGKLFLSRNRKWGGGGTEINIYYPAPLVISPPTPEADLLDSIKSTEKNWEMKDVNGNRTSINNNVIIYLSCKFERVTICSCSHAFIKTQRWYSLSTKKIKLGGI